MVIVVFIAMMLVMTIMVACDGSVNNYDNEDDKHDNNVYNDYECDDDEYDSDNDDQYDVDDDDLCDQ